MGTELLKCGDGMASIKKGFIFYNIDTNRYQDYRIKRLKKDFGCAGIAVYDYILCEIYRVEGCFIKWDENTVFDVAEYFGLKETLVNEIVAYCCNVGLFSKELYASEKVLSSLSIQSRFIEMSKRAKRTESKIPEEYIILPEESAKLPEESGGPSGSLAQSRVKDSKVKKSRVKKSKGLDAGASPHSQAEIDQFKKFEAWILKSAPNVSRMKEPFTLDEYIKLKGKLNSTLVRSLLLSMHNYKPLLQKNISAYLTLLKWSKKEFNTEKNESTIAGPSPDEQKAREILDAADRNPAVRQGSASGEGS